MITERDMQFVKEARQFADRVSPDTSRKTGCVIVSEDGTRIVIHAANTFPTGVAVTPERQRRPYKYAYTEHAERNAIYDAAKHGIQLQGLSMYLPWYPCADCARAIVLSGIARLVASQPDWTEERYNFFEAEVILREGGVTVDLF